MLPGKLQINCHSSLNKTMSCLRDGADSKQRMIDFYETDLHRNNWRVSKNVVRFDKKLSFVRGVLLVEVLWLGYVNRALPVRDREEGS